MDQERERTLITLLAENAKLSPASLAAMLDEREETVAAAIDRLEKSGVIRGYAAIVNWDKVERDQVTAMIEVKVTPQRSVGFDAVARRIERFPEVEAVTLVSGTYDLEVIVSGPRIQEVARFVSERLATIEGVESTTTHFILKRYKVDGVILDDPDDDGRLVVSP